MYTYRNLIFIVKKHVNCFLQHKMTQILPKIAHERKTRIQVFNLFSLLCQSPWGEQFCPQLMKKGYVCGWVGKHPCASVSGRFLKLCHSAGHTCTWGRFKRINSDPRIKYHQESCCHFLFLPEYQQKVLFLIIFHVINTKSCSLTVLPEWWAVCCWRDPSSGDRWRPEL